ncbi:MAG: hypothetical protein NTX50_12745, partial [Candidatus Sumerlaeota bacterium]|nr:hypothetical protein [Candidatus Sumerlaeota bacterium]
AQLSQDLTKDFDIECKRLGKTLSANWNFCEQYVVAGIVRFISMNYRYGNNVSSGAMIGYIQSLSPSILLAEINRHIQNNRGKMNGIVPDIDFQGQDAQNPPTLMADQSLKRNEVQPLDFSLYHLWVNLCST